MLDFAVRLSKEAGSYLKKNFKTELSVELKGRIDPVTQIDRGSQDIIVSQIEKTFPTHGIVAEEGVSKEGQGEYSWYIDPLDGTVNYLHGIPIFCVSIALYKNDEPFIGVCYNPMSNELYHAQKGEGAFRNSKRISVSSTARLIDSLIVTGFPYFIHEKGKMDEIISRFSRILGEVQGVRRLGSAALDLCYVANGAFDGYWEIGLNPWDIAAGVIIVREAGGCISGLYEGSFTIGRGDVLASNPRIHEALKRLV